MKSLFFTGSLLVSSFVLAGCNSSVTMEGDPSRVLIEKDNAEKLDVILNIAAGELLVSEGAKEWVEGELQYSTDKLKPEISYNQTGKKGMVLIEHTNKKFTSLKGINIKSIWDLQLSKHVPIDLEVNTGASKTQLDLQGIQLSSLKINVGVGSTTIDLAGNWKQDFDVQLSTGVGKSTIILPKNVGVKIVSSKGIGHSSFKGFISMGNDVYVNEAYENAKVTITVNADLGIGEADFILEK
ncbi:toast rack family protein [Cytobacillus sp.]|uniref:toast rack family protein n=1 Tax=Cytobacillus sp. TaxID=2675269 RepID=UPI0028BDE35D|nr:toast rack family protein [Cytobacillus sp.]